MHVNAAWFVGCTRREIALSTAATRPRRPSRFDTSHGPHGLYLQKEKKKCCHAQGAVGTCLHRCGQASTLLLET